MNVTIQGWTPSPTFDMPSYVNTRLYFAVGRFTSRILRVSVRLRDANAHKGGIDKHCRMSIFLKDGSEVVVEKVASDWPGAVNAAASCAGRVLGRAVRLNFKQRRTEQPRLIS